MLFTSEFTLPKSNFYCLSFSFDYLICRSSYLSEEKLTETLSSLRGYQWENHAKGATVHITELAQTFHIGITWRSIGRYGNSFVQASFFSFFSGGVPLNSQIYTEICANFVIFWMTRFLANFAAIQVKQNSHKLLMRNFIQISWVFKKKNKKVLAELQVKWNTWWFTQRYCLLLWYIKRLDIA